MYGEWERGSFLYRFPPHPQNIFLTDPYFLHRLEIQFTSCTKFLAIEGKGDNCILFSPVITVYNEASVTYFSFLWVGNYEFLYVVG